MATLNDIMRNIFLWSFLDRRNSDYSQWLTLVGWFNSPRPGVACVFIYDIRVLTWLCAGFLYTTESLPHYYHFDFFCRCRGFCHTSESYLFLIILLSDGCGTSFFKCDSQKCISRNRLCDNVDDCGDYGDERNCRHSRKAFTFTSICPVLYCWCTFHTCKTCKCTWSIY